MAEQNTEPMIRCVGVTKTFRAGDRSVQALRGVDLEIARGSFVAIMGRSGSGKSTLLHVLGALDEPDAGEIEVAGVRLDGIGEHDATRFRGEDIGIVFQQFNLIPTLNAIENVELPGLLRGMPTSETRARAGSLLEKLGLSARADHRPEAMSGGEQQRVAIARALLLKPGVLLADEPTGSLDSASSDHLWELLDEVASDEGLTVVMVTHEPSAAAHAERVVVLADGRVSGEIGVGSGGTRDAAGVAARYQELAGSA